MKHRHLNHQEFTLAAIDDVLDRGQLSDWIGLFARVKEDPYGEVARRLEEVAMRGAHYGRDALALATLRRARNEPTAASARPTGRKTAFLF